MGFRIHKGIWQFQKSDGTYESKYRINSEGTLVETDTDGNEAGNLITTPDWSNITGKPTNLSSFTNDLGNYGGWLTTSGKAADANLLDGLDSSRFVYGDGSNGKSINKTDSNANTSDSSNASGFYFGTRVTGMPTTDWWNWVTVRGNSWSGSDGYHFQLAGSFWSDDFRIRRMQSGSNQPWVTLIHSGNIGSQSVNYATTAGSANAVAWGNVSGKPSTFAPSSHTHDDRYYTESESDSRFVRVGASSILMANNDGFEYDDTNNVMYVKLDGTNRALYHTGNFTDNSSNWNTAYNWGNHASAGYLKSYSESDTLATVTSRGASTSGNIYVNGLLTGGLGAVTTSGTLDWNDSSNARAGQGYTLLLGSHSNGPGPAEYFHPVGFEYSSKNGTGNVTQLAISYGSPGDKMYMRGRYSGAWTGWTQFITSQNIASQSVNYASSAGSVAWGNITGVPSSFTPSSHSHDRIYITDSRGSSRAPSYYDDRYAQWDFQNESDTGITAGDSWQALLTVSKWSVYDASHPQEQLIFTGADLYRRTATSDSAWGGVKKIWDSGNLNPIVGTSYNSSGDIITYTYADGSTSSIDIVDNNSNTYVTGASFNTSDGVLTLTRNSGSVTVDLDNRYAYLSHTHDDRYYTESESDSRFVLNTSRGQIGNSTVSVGSTANWPMNPTGGTYTTSYSGHGGTVIMSADVGGSAGSIGLEFTYNGQFYYHSNTDSNRWTSHQVWTSANFANNSGNWNTAYGWGNHANAGYLTRATQLYSPNNGVVAADAAMPSDGQSFIHTLALGPNNNDGHILGMTWTGTSVYGAQIFLDTDPNDIMAIRSRSNSGVWTDWKTVIHSGTIGSQSVNYASSAGNADTVDSLHASSFLRSDSTNSLFRTTAGNGLGLRFWDSDNYKIWMSSTGDGTWGGRLDSSSDYNMYFKMSGGTNRGFAFKNSTTTVAQIDGGGTIYTASNGNSSQWDSAYRWGNHASAGYVASNGSTWTPHASTNRDASWNSFYTNYGYISFGPANSSWAHIYSDKNFYFNQNLYVNGAKMATESYVTSRGYITSVPAQSWDSITGKPSTFSPSSHTHGIGSVTDASRWWNNFGDNHSTRTSFDAAGSALSTGFGWRYVQGSGNSPGWGNTGNNQYYALTVGLGNDYDYNLYGMQLAIPRQGVTPYLSIRFEENRVLGAWQKISAGYADSAGSVAWANVSGKPSTFSPSSHNHDDRYYTESEVNTLLAGKQAAGTYLTSLPSHDHSSISGTAQGLSIRGYGTDSFSFQQTSSTFAGWGGWANHFIGNHGNGATYYNTVHTMPFWSSPMYSRLEGGNQTEIFQYWTEENFDPGSKANLNGSLGTDFYANKMYSDNWFRAKGACGLYFEDYGYGLWSAYSAGATYGNVSTYATGRNGWTGYSVNNWISLMAIDTRRGLFLTDQDRWLIKWDNSEAFSDYEIMMGSDGRNKSNVQTLTNSLDKVLSLRGVSYNYKNQEKTSIGFIAQEVKEVIPEVVSLDSEGYYAVGYQNLVAVLAEAIKEQQAQIDELKQIINNLTK